MSEFDELRAAAEAANKWNDGRGWHLVPGQIYVRAPAVHVDADPANDDLDDGPEVVCDGYDQDVEFIAAADPPTVLRLLDRLGAAEARVAAVRETVGQLSELTEGVDRIGTARWNEPARDGYSLAVEECKAVLEFALDGETSPEPHNRPLSAEQGESGPQEVRR